MTTESSHPANEAWRRLFDLFMAVGAHFDAALHDVDLSHGDARALRTLDVSTPKTMGDLAAEWMVDRSTATWMVDRLVNQGLAERAEDPADRRRRIVLLTAEGERRRNDLATAMYRPPELLAAADEKALGRLVDALKALPLEGLQVEH